MAQSFRDHSAQRTTFGAADYAVQAGGSRASAAVTVPAVIRLLRPNSVVDIGCGVGTWLAEFMAAGLDDVFGIDGEAAGLSGLQIPAEKFAVRDLSSPLSLSRRFDLAVSLEVAEHLPASAAGVFVASLVAAAPVVLFSAAVPDQGGPGHINEQWQDWWRAHFQHHGYLAVDALRPLVWGNARVEWWYQQNMMLYCSAEALQARPELIPVPGERSLDIVHPILYRRGPNPRRMLSLMPGLARQTAAGKLKKLIKRLTK